MVAVVFPNSFTESQHNCLSYQSVAYLPNKPPVISYSCIQGQTRGRICGKALLLSRLSRRMTMVTLNPADLSESSKVFKTTCVVR